MVMTRIRRKANGMIPHRPRRALFDSIMKAGCCSLKDGSLLLIVSFPVWNSGYHQMLGKLAELKMFSNGLFDLWRVQYSKQKSH